MVANTRRFSAHDSDCCLAGMTHAIGPTPDDGACERSQIDTAASIVSNPALSRGAHDRG
jgi:hypothetical protein